LADPWEDMISGFVRHLRVFDDEARELALKFAFVFVFPNGRP
jgi:hypothetical protein